MNVHITPHKFTGTVKVPASKSHTIRQLLIASLADGVSEIKHPLDSLDTRSCVSVCEAFGAQITEHRAVDTVSPNPEDEKGEKLIGWKIVGNKGFKGSWEWGVGSRESGLLYENNLACQQDQTTNNSPHSLLPTPHSLNVGNSGTTLYLALAVAGLQTNALTFTGDEQIQKRSAAPLLDALVSLGVQCTSSNGCAPITIKGPWKGGKATLPCPVSQYLSALLIAAPLAPSGVVTEIDVPLLNEKPYVEITLSYLKAHSIPFEAAPDYSHFVIPGGSSWRAFSNSVPADFSSAAFPAAAAAITGGPVTLLGLDPEDTQGDKFVFDMLKAMGCGVQWGKNDENDAILTIFREGPLRGGTFDLNKTPDLLPAAAVIAAYADGDTAFINIPHARIKETDRIAVMAAELAKLGVKCTERPDDLVVHGKGALSPLSKTVRIDGRGDHRVVMAFAAAALGSPVPIEITTAESAAVTYPGFLELLNAEKSA